MQSGTRRNRATAPTRYGAAFWALIFCASIMVVLFAVKLAAQDGGWQIQRAEYGTPAQHVDVTDILQRLLWEGRANGRVPVNNQSMGGDPAVGADKVLHIVAQNGRNEQRTFDYIEGSWIDVSLFALQREHHDGGDDWDRPRDGGNRDAGNRDAGNRDGNPGGDNREAGPGLRIVRGYWGAQGQTVNVTQMLQSMIRNGVLFVHVDNASLGGDPAMGRDKVLIVIYFAQGREQATSVKEGNSLRIP